MSMTPLSSVHLVRGRIRNSFYSAEAEAGAINIHRYNCVEIAGCLVKESM